MEDKKSVLITGSSTGIGRASALRLDKEGFQVFAGVRKSSDGDALRNASSGNLIPLILDVRESESIAKAVETVSEKTNGELFGLMNNAGISAGSTVELTPVSALRDVLEVNFIGYFALTKAFLPLLRRSRGRIVNTGSVFGLTALPGVSAYAASKYAVEAISESLRVELRPFGISVSVLEPGAIATEIWKKVTAQNEELIANANPDTYKLYAPLMQSGKNIIEKQKYLSPEAVAERVYHAFTARKPKNHYVVGMDAKLFILIESLPEKVRDWMMYKYLYNGVELTQAWNGKERRNEPRNKVELSCVVDGLFHGEQTCEMGQVIELTEHGMYVEAHDPLDEGTETKAQIKGTRFSEAFWVMGKVLRRTAKGMAIRFADPVPKEVEMILTTR